MGALVPRPNISSGIRNPYASVSPGSRDDGGQTGYNIPPSGSPGTWEAAGVYEVSGGGIDSFPYYVNLLTGYDHVLYAPTTLPPNDACIEFGIAYQNTAATMGANVQEASIYAADWCNAPWYKPWNEYVPTWSTWPINDAFFQKYVRVFSNGDGLPETQLEEKETSDGTWHLFIFDEDPACTNTSTCSDRYGQQYVDIYDSYGESHAPTGQVPTPGLTGYTSGAGWTIFETHYNLDNKGAYGSDCPVLPVMNMSGLRSQEYIGSSTWSYTNIPGYQLASNSGQCFDSSSAPYYYAWVNTDVGWYVATSNVSLGSDPRTFAPMQVNQGRIPAWPDAPPMPKPTLPPCYGNLSTSKFRTSVYTPCHYI